MNKPKHAFTFIELLVVVTLYSILSLAVYATFASGMRLWRRIQDTSLLQRKASLGLEKFSQEARQALDFSKIGFTGKSNEISFPFLSGEEILKITYFFDQNALLRKQESFKDILEKKEQATIKTLLSGLEDLKFSFAYQEVGKTEYSWKDVWDKDKEKGIPAIVKMELKTKDANFTKTVIIPAS
jgi:prepilin-type N-terminal cleavage/methylation domain-containing protein